MKPVIRSALSALVAGVALMTLTAPAATAGEKEITSARYAPVTTGKARVFHNRHSFTCAGNGLAYCEHLPDRKYSPEEEELMEGNNVLGDITVLRDRGGDGYAIAGQIYVMRTCDIATGYYSDQVRAPRLYEFEPVSCTSNDDGSIDCPLVDPADENDGIVQVFLNIRQDSPKTIRIIGEPNPDYKDQYSPNCFDAIGSTVFHLETPDEFAHNMYLSARLEFNRVDGDLNALWKSLPAGLRKAQLPDQRKWISRKDAKCGAVTMKGSEKKLTDMYVCQIHMTEDRIQELSIGD